jgi:gamma-glutamyltranspeptidase/glutathione hydrolase
LRVLLSLWLLALPCASVAAPVEAPPAAAVASAHPDATAAGLEALDAGGNAFDAAVAISAALAVVEPWGSGLGGGGFWLLHRASDGKQIMLDGRERAPLAAHRDMFLDSEGRFVPGLALDGPLAAGIPGEPAALAHLAEHYGRLPLATSLRAAIRLARDGVAVDEQMRRMLTWRRDALAASPAASARFLLEDEAPPAGHLVRQPHLAATLQRLAAEGREGFYRGETAERLVTGVRAAGGIWTLKDLHEYEVVERQPIVGRYRGWRVVSAAPPSSGGVLLVQMLNMLETLDVAQLPAARRAHVLVEVMRRAYRDRARYLGDPDFVDMPLQRLTHPFYAAGLVRDLRLDRATPSDGWAPRLEGAETTHFCVLDSEGNRVAATLSINYPFGSGFVAPGTGVLLNNEMDDFSARPGVANAYGLIGGKANAIAPGKRMLSSMTPTFAESERGVALLGTPGGSRIITMVLQALLALDGGQGLERVVANPRLHHQFLPDEIQYEPGAIGAAERDRLASLGHRLHLVEDGFGDMQAVFWDRAAGEVRAASDPRGRGHAQAHRTDLDDGVPTTSTASRGAP